MLSVSGLMEPLPRLYLPTTIDNIRHFSTPVSMASKYQSSRISAAFKTQNDRFVCLNPCLFV